MSAGGRGFRTELFDIGEGGHHGVPQPAMRRWRHAWSGRRGFGHARNDRWRYGASGALSHVGQLLIVHIVQEAPYRADADRSRGEQPAHPGNHAVLEPSPANEQRLEHPQLPNRLLELLDTRCIIGIGRIEGRLDPAIRNLGYRSERRITEQFVHMVTAVYDVVS
jgi:hypothetical protein